MELKDFIQVINAEKGRSIYPVCIEGFIKDFPPTDYTYDELVSLSDGRRYNLLYKQENYYWIWKIS